MAVPGARSAPTVVNAGWTAFTAHPPEQEEKPHPLGCHRPRISDRERFEAFLFRLVTGCSWDVAGRLGKVSETTLRRRGHEWVEAGVFELLVTEALCGYNRVIGLDLSEVSLDGCCTRRPEAARGRAEPGRPG
jgi:transposase